MKDIMISVIVPVYNTEKFLSKCIESILKQTYQNFELLLIDDGSPDECGNICDRFAEQDKRIRVFHKENGGVSSARNLGLENAKGDYICFIDSDDYIGENYLNIHLPVNGEDFIQSGVSILENDYLKSIMTYEDIFENYNMFWMLSRQVWPTKCCLSKQIIVDNDIKFDENLTLGEDGLFNHLFISKCKKIRRTNVNEYFYNLDNMDSISHKYYPNRLEQQIYLIKQLDAIFPENQTYRINWDYWHEVLNHYQIKGLKSNDKVVRKNARQRIKETYDCKEFRKCISSIRNNGSIDEKIETYFMNYYTHFIYNIILVTMKLIYKNK